MKNRILEFYIDYAKLCIKHRIAVVSDCQYQVLDICESSKDAMNHFKDLVQSTNKYTKYPNVGLSDIENYINDLIKIENEKN